MQVQKGKPVAESAGSASATTDFDDDDDYDDGFLKEKGGTEMTETTEKVVPKTTNLAPEEITNKDVTKSLISVGILPMKFPIPFERYLAPSLLYAMMPLLKKLYKDDEQLKSRLYASIAVFQYAIKLGRRGHYWVDGFYGTRAGQRRT